MEAGGITASVGTITKVEATREAKKTGFLSEAFWKTAEFNRFGIISILLIVVVCLGGVAAAYGVQNENLSLIFAGAASLATLTAILAVAPMKWVLGLGTLAIVVNITLICTGLFS